MSARQGRKPKESPGPSRGRTATSPSPPLEEYRAKRDFQTTAEPAGGEVAAAQAPEAELRFVIQEHHARRLHWDFRLERDGVLVSWALPKGVPEDPGRNHLAVHVEDHPLEYGSFEGEIPRGEYGAGSVSIWDRGTYETHKWAPEARKPEVMVTLHGERVQGRYVLFQTRGKDWMIHRMDPPQEPGYEAPPERVEPMMAKLAEGLPGPDRAWAYEFKWDGVRAMVFSQGGDLRVVSRKQEDVTARYPELRGIATALGSHAAVLDGEIVALGEDGVPSFEQLQQRMGLRTPADVRRQMKLVPVAYLAYDVVYLDGRRLFDRPYEERRRLLASLQLSGPHWQVPEHHVGDGEAMLDASQRMGLEGVIAKRLDSRYEEGRRSGDWLKVKHHHRQEFVVGGWTPGEGKRAGVLGALLIGYTEDGKLVYASKVGTGFDDATLDRLTSLLEPLARRESPFEVGEPPRNAHYVEPRLVVEVEFANWTRGGQLRAPSYKGLREDKDPSEVVRERPQP
jgi:bifunctional non-homologous end joining protein LigD